MNHPQAVSALLETWRTDARPLTRRRPRSKPLCGAQTMVLPDAMRSIVVQFTPYASGRVWVRVIDYNPKDTTEGLYPSAAGQELWFELARLGFRQF